jgi:NhaP-type Na+/H+ or K+/H+ antiporter
MTDPQLVIASIVVMGVLSHWLAWRLRLPAILFLLLIGIVAGPVLGVVRPDMLFGEALFGLVSLSVAIILFEGSLTLRWSELRGIGMAVWGLVSAGALVTFALVAIASHYVLQISWPVSCMIGAICTVTGPTVVVPMLRAIRPNSAISKTLRWEGIVIDPIGAMLAVLVYEFILTSDLGAASTEIGRLIVSGMIFGLAAAFALGYLLRHHLVPWYLRDIGALAFVLASFAGANYFSHEAGLLAVTVMGVTLANMKQINVDDILEFKESLTLLLVAILFITLAARLDFSDFSDMNWRLALFLAAIILVIRPMAVFASTMFSKLQFKEKLLISWISPRGIVAAVVAALFALKLQELNVPDAELLVPVIFAVIISTVVLQSATAARVANWLGLSNPDPRGVIILGANEVNRAFARKLVERDYDVLLADTDWAEVRRARMDGFNVYFGRIVSDHAEGTIDHGNIGYLFGMSERRDRNLLACLHFRPELGGNAVFVLDIKETGSGKGRGQELVGGLSVPNLFGEEFHFGEWQRLYRDGGDFRMTRLTEEFGFDEFRESLPGEFVPLLGIDSRGRLHPFTNAGRPTVRAGWYLMSLVPRETLDKEAEAREAAEASGKRSGRRAERNQNQPAQDQTGSGSGKGRD